MDGNSLLPLAADRGLEYGRDLLIEHAPSNDPAQNVVAIRSPTTSTPSTPTATASSTTCAAIPSSSTAATPTPATPRSASRSARLAALRRCRGRQCSAGPRMLLGFRFRDGLAGRGRCVADRLRVNLAASGAARATGALFYVDGRFAGRDTRAGRSCE